MTHRHEWIATNDGWACAECGEASATCVVTHKGETHPTGTSLLICDDCLDDERRLLDQIIEARDGMVVEPRSVVPAYAYGPTRAHSTDPERLPYGLDRAVDDPDWGIQGIRTGSGVDDELWGWAALWADASGHAENVDHVDYLKGHLMWAAHNPAAHFHAYRRAVRELLGRARSLGAPKVEKAGPHCLDCGGALVREWREDGLGDEVRCRVCAREYGAAAYRLAFRAKLDRERAATDEALVNQDEARLILPSLPESNLRTWTARGRIEPRGKVKGRTVWRLGDIRKLMECRTDSTGQNGVA